MLVLHPGDELGVNCKLFHNAAAASAIADRLVHKGILIKILGKSKRSNEEIE